MVRLVFTCIAILTAFGAFSQSMDTPLFPDGSRVCFVGNSITNNGEYYNNLWLYHATRFPKDKIVFYNCGISGDIAGGVLKRMDKDILVHEPSHIVLMIGMNDVQRSLYREEGNDSLKLNALDLYRANTEKAVSIFKETVGNITLLKPSIYDQTAKVETENLYGVNDALQLCGEHMAYLSEKYQTGLVDFQTVMLDVNREHQRIDPAFTITSKDRVHPLSEGHFVMTYQFLKDSKAQQFVSRISIGKNLEETEKNKFNCTIEKLDRKANGISFECLEGSLPFPIKESARQSLNWVPFQEEFNQQLLQIDDLPSSIYNLYIDDELITSCTALELSRGINLTCYTNTPQYRQAVEVMKVCEQYRATESIMRSIRFVEFTQLEGLHDQTDFAIVEEHLRNKLEKLKSVPHYEFLEKQFRNYIENKTSERALHEKLAQLADNIYQINKPQKHSYKIMKHQEQ